MGVIWSGFLQQQRRRRRRGGGRGGGKGEAKRQELAPIAIVNPLLAHGDILGLESHKKMERILKLKPSIVKQEGLRNEEENNIYVLNHLSNS